MTFSLAVRDGGAFGSVICSSSPAVGARCVHLRDGAGVVHSQNITDSRLGPQWTPAVVFGYLILVMVLRPRGLLGEETREAG